MKKLIAFLLAAIMLLSLCACGAEKKSPSLQEKKNPFLHPVDFYDREYTERFFGNMGEWAYGELEIENYELHGQKGEFVIEYEGENDDELYGMFFLCGFPRS